MRKFSGLLGRRIWLFVGLFSLMMLVGLPALAQEVPGDAGTGVTAIALVTGAVKLIVDKIRKYAPRLDGELVNVLAFALGYAATYVPDVMDAAPASWTERAAVAIGVAGLSAIFAGLAPSREVAARQQRGV